MSRLYVRNGPYWHRGYSEATVPDLVEALDGERVEHYCVVHHCRAWGHPRVGECTFQRYQRANLGQPAETPCDIRPALVVPLGEDAE